MRIFNQVKLNFRFYFTLIVIGVMAGLIGVFLTFVLHYVQHYAFHYALNGEEISFRQGVTESSPLRRSIVLLVCGVVVGTGWYVIQRYGSKLISIKQALTQPQSGVPFLSTFCHSLLQIITVGLGSPLGREVAPREMSVAFTGLWIRKYRFNDVDAKILLACASGAGLTAVYNVPFAAIIFVLETMLLSFTYHALIASLITITVATAVARFFLGDLIQYAHLPPIEVTFSLFIFSLLIGCLTGIVANIFKRSTQKFPFIPRTDKKIIPFAILAFGIIGCIAIYQPDILGNGKAGNQLTFGEMINAHTSFQLFALKWVAVLLALAAGAYGGLITPSMMLGSTLAYTLAIGWNLFFPQLSIPAAAIIGACVFLGIAQKMPLTAIVFLLELTASSTQMLLPMLLAMSGAVLFDKLLQRMIEH